MPSPDARSQRFPLEAADRCVMCGLCLPHCPTYRLTLNEGESPRGRIALMTALARETLPPTAKLQGHLDRCLGCRACERMCPSKVPYGELIDSGQALLQPSRTKWRSWLTRFAMNKVLGHPSRVTTLAKALRLSQRSGLARLAPLFGLERAAELLPELPVPRQWQAYYPATGAYRGDVALFTGCLGSVVEQTGNADAIALLNRFGFGVHIPSGHNGQTCCGALQLHSGDRDAAERLARRNLNAFRDLPVQAILCTASACTLTLSEYNALTPQAEPISDRTQEVGAFLAQQTWPSDLKPQALAETVALHHPCSQVHGLGSHSATHELLRHIPAVDVIALPTQAHCCGAAGSYMLRQPPMADTLGGEVLDQVGECGASILVSSNIGCALHLQARARNRRMDITIVHPVSLLRRQIELADAAVGAKIARTLPRG